MMSVKYIVFFFVVLILASCKDINYVMPLKKSENSSVNVYLAGAKMNGTDTAWSATYWKNGVSVSLTNGLVNSSLFSICVTESAIDVAGYQGSELKYWKNGIGVSLGDSARSRAMSVVNSDVYLAGWTITNTAVFWKNGVRKPVSPNAIATCLAVVGNDIYIAGYEGSVGFTTPVIWKNGSSLGDLQSNGEINSIVVSGTDVYAAGSYLAFASQNPLACYWKNSTPYILSDASHTGSANCIFISGSDVYVAGYETNSSGFKVAKYWKNGIAVTLSNGTRSQEAHAIAVSGNDVYVTCDGLVPNSSILFKNGSTVQPFDGTSNRYFAFALTIK